MKDSLCFDETLFSRWTYVGRRMVVSLTRMNRIRKCVAFAVFCLGCVFLATILLIDPSKSLRLVEPENLKRISGINLVQREKTSYAKSPSMQEASQLEVQLLRTRRILRTCERLNASGKLLSTNKTLTASQFDSIYIDDDRRILYCSIPKVACTNWKRIFLIMTGKMNTTRPSDLDSGDVHGKLEKKFLRRLNNYTMEEIEHRINTYYKFLFVREPFERLLSAYFNKFTTKYNRLFRRAYGQRIIKLYRKNQPKTSGDDGGDVRFEEFVAYLLDPRTTKHRPFNQHWMQYYELCHPCLIQYDFVGKYETMQEDADLVLRQLGVASTVTFPSYQKRVKTSNFLAQKFANISTDDIHRLWNLYSIDFDLFDYPYPSLRLNSSHRPITSRN